jgi:pyrroloquinoline quinone (PQQ) biosynthesis protein C
MELSKGQRLRNKIEELEREYGISEAEAKQLFIKEYLLDEDKPSADEILANWLKGNR